MWAHGACQRLSGMNHRRECERIDRVMTLNTESQHLGIKQYQLAPDRINLASFITLNSFRILLKNLAVATKMGQLLN